MLVIEQSWDWVQKPDSALTIIERAGRTCYKSEDKITDGSAEQFARKILGMRHESVIEHVCASIRFITNRGVTHELVRHRLCSYSQESTRFVRYEGDMEFIKPVWWDDWTPEQQAWWTESMSICESHYQRLLSSGSKPEQAREVLPNSLKTEIVVTANIRQWRHMFGVRCRSMAHPQIRQLMFSCLKGFAAEFPVLFEDVLAAVLDE